jgi:hypothetical protein
MVSLYHWLSGSPFIIALCRVPNWRLTYCYLTSARLYYIRCYIGHVSAHQPWYSVAITRWWYQSWIPIMYTLSIPAHYFRWQSVGFSCGSSYSSSTLCKRNSNNSIRPMMPTYISGHQYWSTKFQTLLSHQWCLVSSLPSSIAWHLSFVLITTVASSELVFNCWYGTVSEIW